jgi:hypothetical protein
MVCLVKKIDVPRALRLLQKIVMQCSLKVGWVEHVAIEKAQLP